MLRGLMMDMPLMVSSLIRYAAEYHGEREMVSVLPDGGQHRTNYAEIHGRAQKLANMLTGMGIGVGDRVGTLAWNTHRHVELYFGISGMGAVCHTINPRLFPDQINYIINHAEDRILFVDTTFVPLLEGMVDSLTGLEAIVIMTDPAHMPETTLPNVHCYETLLAPHKDSFDWPLFDENTAAALCYTSGTTGNPKGVLYSHRSTVIHAFCACSKDTLGVSSNDTILVIVPLFHACAWGMPYAAAMSGAKLVLPGADLDGETLHRLIHAEGITASAAVPTVWLGLLQYLDSTGNDLGKLERVAIGGTAPPPSMIETLQNRYNVRVIHAWGMTETSPLGTTGTLKASAKALPPEEQFRLQQKQGRGIYGVEMKIVDDDGRELPRDGVAFGNLLVRGPWIASGYFKGEGGDPLTDDGWFPTGDVSTIDPHGYMQITDRAKDVIKSGGEWISSIDLENAAAGHPDVHEAAVIGVRHPKWDERPLLIVVPAEGKTPDKDDLLGYLSDKVAKWWLPDDVVIVDELPHTATGKVTKLALREQFSDYQLPTVSADS